LTFRRAAGYHTAASLAVAETRTSPAISVCQPVPAECART